jgi:hypothetical protein
VDGIQRRAKAARQRGYEIAPLAMMVRNGGWMGLGAESALGTATQRLVVPVFLTT